ncbi:unnamed protein product [Rotaria magnacalcarata]|uniref:DNA topoisomerase I n=1 Tax=Rotaria magnacalcarata TaxID=392030 RepID=A0A816L3K7_9BILA|nr:unnamed protein product [Rotaria magnacalcarata]CAF1642901.1 unnamed protein product [Rotaria magnacalcarata]CAF1935546.1 unnamed protein product [Rotaria magnacalcarata]CAF1961498.1 unnamed protein product [Rotaria magnacalcarata]CAF2245776.1 unnamed protein product [Rotaria magnacalcarata]
MTSIANPKLTTSMLSTNTNSTKNTSSSSTKKEVNNNNTSRSSNGNTSKSPINNKKEPAQSSQVKRKSRVLSSSDESDDDNQSLAKKAAAINGQITSTSVAVRHEPKKDSSPTKKDTPETPTIKKEPVTPAVKKESTTPVTVKQEPKSESAHSKRKNTHVDTDDDDIPLAKKAKNQAQRKSVPVVKKEKISDARSSSTGKSPSTSSSSNRKSSTNAKQEKVTAKKELKPTISSSPTKESTGKRKKKEEDEDVWRWWEEEKYTDGRKWTTLEHKGPLFPPPYESLPPRVKFFYNGTEVKLKDPAEEIMTFYSRMLDHDYTSKEVFNTNFMTDWRKSMTQAERELIKDIRKCDFTQVANYFKEQTEQRKAMSKEEKKNLKDENEKLRKEYGYCMWDKHRQPVGNYKIEPPGLFRGRGEHPKMGCVKKRIRPEDVIINIGREAHIPKPPEGHHWKEVRHDNKVSWLVMWTENIRGNNKYIMLNASSRVKGERDWQKYEKARKLHRVIDKIRENYQIDWKSKEMRIRQRAVALYFIDKLALRVGNEKDEDEADTVGCCSLRVEHIKLYDRIEIIGENIVEFDFLGKDSIRYTNKVSVEPRVYKNLKLFMENKEDNDDLFDRLTTSGLNQYLSELMDGLTAKVFRTYNASKTLQDQLDLLTNSKANVPEKVLAYNRANRQVALLCNHQRSIPKTFEKSMETLKAKIDAKKAEVTEQKAELKRTKLECKNSKSQASQKKLEQIEKKFQRSDDALKKLELQALDREENKDIALGTSKLNYLDPRISVAWCKKWNVPIEKIYSKTQRDKFRWAIDMATADYHFHNYKGEIVLRNVDESNNNGDEEDDDEEQNSDDE